MVKITAKSIPVDLRKQFSLGRRTIKGITLHETGNDLSARENYELMLNSQRNYSTNVFIDEQEILIVIPLSYSALHTGKGYDKGNINTIAIEICRSRGKQEDYEDALRNAISYVKELLQSYALTKDEIYFHQDFNPKFYCPHRILSEYGSKQEFIRKEFDL